MFVKSLIVKCLFIVLLLPAFVHGTPRLITLRGDDMEQIKAKIQKGTPDFKVPMGLLLRSAEKTLKNNPYTVTSKTILPPSGDKHDFISIGPYIWPAITASGKTTYTSRDGVSNPDNDKGTDGKTWGLFRSELETVSLAWYFTNDERYGRKAAELISTWFLNPKTRMNPNAQYAQWVPGKNSGTAVGTISVSPMARVCDSLVLMEGFSGWTTYYPDGKAGYKREMTQWMRQYLTWLTDSPNGKKAAELKNNIGTWYQVQLAGVALYTGDKEIARRAIEKGKILIASQIEPDGSQPLELKRTKAFSYSIYNLSAYSQLAEIAHNINVDLWNYVTPEGRSLPKAVEFLAPYRSETMKWPYKEISPKGMDYAGLSYVSWMAYVGTHNLKFKTISQESLPKESWNMSRNRLLYLDKY